MQVEPERTPKTRTVVAGTTVVLAANELNVSIFKPVWLCQFEILKPEELTENLIISPAVVEIPTPNFHLSILPNRLQMQFPSIQTQLVEEPLNRVLGGILRTLPHTPFAAIGLNFNFFVAPKHGESFDSWNRAQFSSKAADAICSDPTAHPRFGAYFSFDVLGMRLKVDVKPIHPVVNHPQVAEELAGAPEWMLYALNYHQDLDPAAASKAALDRISKWSAVASHAHSILDKLRS